MKNEVEGLGRVSVVKLEEMREGFALLEGNDGEQGIARECQIESGLWSSMAVPVFLPGGGVAFVVVAVREQMARFWRIVVDGGIWQKGER